MPLSTASLFPHPTVDTNLDTSSPNYENADRGRCIELRDSAIGSIIAIAVPVGHRIADSGVDVDRVTQLREGALGAFGPAAHLSLIHI